MKKGYVISTMVCLLVLFFSFSPSVFAFNRSITGCLGQHSRMVTLTTVATPTFPDETVAINNLLNPDGTSELLEEIPDGFVLVVTDVDAHIPFISAEQGRYTAYIRRPGAALSSMTIGIETSVDGFQKTLSFTSVTVFTNLPELYVSVFNPPAGMAIIVHGYMCRSN